MRLLRNGLWSRALYVLVLLFVAVMPLRAQPETLSTGSFIINMGVEPQTVANGLRPYGLVYDLIRNYNVPIKWVIGEGKARNGIDFTYNSVQYKGGTFIIPAEYRTAAVNARITFWQGQGVVGATTTSPLTVNVTQTLKQVPKWTLDAANGSIAQGYLTNAGITLAAFPGAYNWRAVSTLDCCDDFFVMPHADPTWATHNRLYTWNKDCLGSVWAACHAVSALENAINPSNSAEQMNFLSQRNAGITTPTPWPNNSLILWKEHAAGSPPYTHRLNDDPVMQFLGNIDAATQNGSEQIYIPREAVGASWNPDAKILVYDPTQANVPVLQPDLSNAATVMVYGRAFDDTTRGYVMYEAGHSHNKATAPANIAAQRAFFNFSWVQLLPKAPALVTSGVSSGDLIPGGGTVSPSVSASSPLVGITFSYNWTSTCGGSFSGGNTPNPTFTAPIVVSNTPCVITVEVTDQCGRKSFAEIPVIIQAANAPIAVPDVVTIDPACTGEVSVARNVLANDSDPDGDPISLTQVNGDTSSPFILPGQGTVSFSGDGNITFTAVEGFTGAVILTYQVCDDTPLCANSTFTINVGDPQKTPVVVNDSTTINEDVPLVNFDVLSNDQAASDTKPGGYTGGTLSLYSATVPLAQGWVSANPNGTITFVPAIDFSGTATITYVAINTAGYKVTGTLTVTVTGDACDSGTYEAGSATPTIVSGNDWSQVYERPVNTGGNNITNTTPYTINAGSNRLLVVAISAGGPNGTVTAPTVSWGGQSLTAYSGNVLASNRAYSFIYYLGETGIAAATNDSLVVTFGNQTWYGYVVHAAVYENVLQTAPGPLRVGATSANNGASASPLTASVTVPSITAGDQGIFVTAYSVNGGTNSATYSSVSTNWTGSSGLFGGKTNTSAPTGPYYGGVGVRNVTTAATNEVASMTVTLSAGNMRPNITVASIVPSGASCAAIPNRAPLANPDYTTTNSTTAVSVAVLDNDVDPDGDAISIADPSVSILVGGGTAVIDPGNPDNVLYTPSGSFLGQAIVAYSISDGTLLDTAYIYITVTSSPPVANGDTASVLSNVTGDPTSVSIDVQANDSDPDGPPPLVTSIFAQPKNGTAIVSGINVVYTPDLNFTGVDTLIYRICETDDPDDCDPIPQCDTAMVIITVLNRPPVAGNVTDTIIPCEPNTINLLANSTDPENGVLTVVNLSPLSDPLAGTLVDNGDGTVTFTPTPGYLGTVSFTYDVQDNGTPPETSAGSALVEITVSLQPNNAPVAEDDEWDMWYNTIAYISVLDNDFDPDGHPLDLPVITSLPTSGPGTTVTVLPNGLIEYTPDFDFYGYDSFTYEICDLVPDAACNLFPDLCNEATVVVFVKKAALFVTKMADPEEYDSVGQVITYTFEIENDGNLPIVDLVVVDSLVDVVPYYVSGDDNANDTLDVGEIWVFEATYAITQQDIDTGFVENFVYVYGLYVDLDSTTGPVEGEGDAGIVANQLPGLEVIKSLVDVRDSLDVIRPDDKYLAEGDVINYQITVENTGNVTQYNVDVTDPNADATPVYVSGDTNSNGALDVGEIWVFTATHTITLADLSAGQVDNVANAAAEFTDLNGDPVYIDEDSDTVTVYADGADLEISKSVVPTSQVVNSQVTFTITVTNNGPANATGVEVKDYLPNGYGSVTNISGGGAYIGDTIIWSGLTVNVGDSVFLTFDATVLSPGPGMSFMNIAEITASDLLDPDPDNNIDSVAVTPIIEIIAVFDDLGSVSSGDSITYDILSNDTLNGVTPVDPALVNITITQDPVKGTASVDPLTGELTYTPNPGESGADTLIYQICDAINPAVCDTALVIVNIDPVIIAVWDDLGSVASGDSVTFDILANDTLNGVTPVDPALVNITITQDPVKGVASVDPVTGELTYTPTPGFSGADTLIYQICDVLNPAVCDTALVIVNIDPVIIAVWDDLGSVASGDSVTFDILANDTLNSVTPVDPALVDITITQDPVKGTASVDPVTGELTYTPTPGFSGADTLIYQICDVLNPAVCDTALVIVNIDPVIIAVWDDLGSVASGDSITYDILSNDTLNGVTPVDPALVNITITQDPVKGTASVDPLTGELTYTPNPGESGADTLIYQICDAINPAVCDTALVIVNIDPVIIAVWDDLGNVSSGDSITYDILSNDTLNGVTPVDPALVNITITQDPVKGTASVDPVTGELTYTPTPGFSGADTLIYQICDVLNPAVCDTALVVVNIDPVIIAVWDDLGSVASGDSITYDILANDTLNGVTPVDPALVNITITQDPVKGTASVDPLTGELTYTPTPGESGADTLIYQICDVLNPTVCDTALVIVNIDPVIIAVWDDLGSVASGDSVTFDILANDTLNGVTPVDPALVDITITQDPVKGVASVDPLTGELTYTPTPGFSGADTLIYQICDVLNPAVCDTALVVVNIDPVIIAVWDDLGSVSSGDSITYDILSNDTLNGVSPVDPVLVNITITQDPVKGTASIDPSTGELTYTPTPGFSGADTLIYQICDVLNPAVCDTALVVVNIDPVIIAVWDDLGSVASGDSITYDILANDTLNGVTPVDPALVNITITQDPVKGTASVDPLTGELTYTPTPGFSGADTLIYQICDVLNPAVCDTALVIVNIDPVIIAVWDDLGSVSSGDSVIFDILANDTLNGVTPVDPALVNITITQDPVKGTASVDPLTGELTYTPAPGESGADTLIYQICDVLNPAVCDTALVIVNIDPVIIAVWDDLGSVSSGDSLTYDILANDTLNGVTPVDPALVNITITQDPVKGTASVDPLTGELTYTPTPGFSGADTLIYQICDVLNPAVCDTALVIVNIDPVIVAVFDDLGSVSSGDSVTFDILANDTLNGVTPVDPALVNITITQDPVKGTASVDPLTGELTYTPTPGFSGADTLIYQICDVLNPAVCDTALVVVNIDPVIVAVFDDLGSVASGDSVTFDILANDTLNGVTPVDPALVNITITQDPVKGTASVDPVTGELTYTPTPGFSGADTLIYQICDVLNPTVCDTALVTVNINPVIVANDDLYGPVSGSTGGILGNALDNDSLNGLQVLIDDIVISVLTPAADPGVELSTATAEVSVTPGTPEGLYTIEYQICDILYPDVCDTAWITVLIVTPDTIPVVLPVDSFATVCVVLNPAFDVNNTEYTLCNGNTAGFSALGIYAIDDDGCLTYTSGSNPGFDEVCVIACDTVLGVCDTTIFEITIDCRLIVTTVDTTICNGESITVGSNIYNATGVYIDTLLAINNCDSIVITNLVVESTPPVIICPADTIVNCDVSIAPANTGVATATDNSSAVDDILITWSDDLSGLNGCAGTGIILRTWYAVDECGNIDSCVQVITVQDTTAPVFNEPLPADTTVDCDAVPVAEVLTADDNCSVIDVDFDEQRTDGSCANNYTLTRTWTATDECGNETVHVQTITVQDTTAPVFNEPLPADLTVDCDAVPVAEILTADDNCSVIDVDFDEQRTDGTCPNSYTLTRTWTATDECGNETVHLQTITVQDTTAPVFNEPLPADTTVDCDAVPVAEILTADDNCSTIDVVYDELRTDGTCPNSYTLTRTWTATDECGNETVHVQIVTVQDTTAPLFNEPLPADLTVDCDAVPTAETLTADDNCSIIDVDFDEQRTDGSCANNYTLTRTWTATDECGNETVHVQTITVQDTTAPVFNEPLPADTTVDCDAVPVAEVLTVSNNCSTIDVVYDEQRTDGACANNYTLTRTWTATDECGNETVHVQTITVQDTTAPVFNEPLPADTTVDCDAVPVAEILTADDNCSIIDVAFDEQRTDGSCPNSYTLTRTWTATDECGNETVHVQTITVQDTTAPVFNEPLPADLTVDCDAVPTAETLTADDNCSTIDVAFDEQRTDGSCANNYTLTRTWTATDECGNETVHVQTITVQDTTAPVFNEPLPADTTVDCDAVPVAEVLTVSNNCSTIDVVYDEQRTDGACANSYTLTRTWTATDECGNETVHVQTITVQDTTAPVFNEPLPVDTTVDCDAVPTAETLTADDNCSVIDVDFDEQRTDGSCPNSYTLTRTWIATDECGNETVHVQTITVQDTTAPVFNEPLPADTTVDCDAVPVAEVLTADDNCSTIDVAFDEQRTDGSCANNYTLTRTWTATDECGNETVHVQTITVQDTTAPVFNEPLPVDTTVDCNAVPTAETLTADDNCSVIDVDFDEQRTDGSCANNYTLTRTWTATDECGNETVHVQTITVQDTTAPVFNEPLPADTTVDCNAVPTAETLTADDNCSVIDVDFDEQRTDGSCANNYTLTRTWTATDECGNETVHVQTITVQDTTAPVFNEPLPVDTTVDCNAVPTAETLTADDNCSVIDVDFDEQRTDGTCANSYTLTRTWTATDECGNETVHVQTVTVQDTTAPVFNEPLPADTTVDCDAVPVAEVLTATDNCSVIDVDFDEQRTDGSCANNYTLTRTWTATDECGNETVHVQTITVQDTTAPVFNEPLPADTTVDCDAVPTAETLTADDNCSVIDVDFDEQRTDGSCPNSYTLTRTWTATDECGNETVHVQTITVQDTTAPVFNEPLPADTTVDCDALPVAEVLTASDNCSVIDVDFDEQRTDGSCANNYTLTRTWTATDECGNETVHVQTITVQDTTAPVFNEPLPQNATICGNVPVAPVLTASDNCGAADVNFNETTDLLTIPGSVIYTRTWTATDACGNTTVHQQTITVHPEYSVSFVTQLCEGETLTIGTTIFTGVAGTFVVNLETVYGCDSIVTVTILPCTDTIPAIVLTDSVITVCVSLHNSFDPEQTVFTLCDGSTAATGTFGSYSVDENGCVTYISGHAPGFEEICVVACDQVLGICDTTIIQITVVPPVPETEVSIRDLFVDSTLTVCVELEDFFVPEFTVYSFCDGSVAGTGNFGTYVIDNEGCVTYTSGHAPGVDTLCVIACDVVLGVCDTTYFVINVIPPVVTPDTIPEIITVDSFVVVCVELDPAFVAEFTTYSFCDGTTSGTGNFGIYTIDEQGCVTYISGNLPGTDTICVIACDEVLGICDTTYIIINIEGCVLTLFDTDSTTILCNETGLGEFCIPLTQLDILVNYDIYVNGELYLDVPGACDPQLVGSYDMGEGIRSGRLIIQPGVTNVITGWTVNGNSLLVNTFVSSLSDIVVLMNSVDPEGDWELVSGDRIAGGATDNTYGLLNIDSRVQNTILATYNAQYSSGFIYNGSKISLPVGCHTVTIVNPVNGCTDSIVVCVECPELLLTDDYVADCSDRAILIDILSNDIIDGEIGSINIVSAPENGTVQLSNGIAIYTPDPDFFRGVDVFTYEVCLAEIPGKCSTATVTIDRSECNRPPVANNDTITTESGTPVQIPVLDNDFDPDGDGISLCDGQLAIVSGPENGIAVVVSGGTIIYTPNTGFAGVDSFQYVVCDEFGLKDMAWVFVNVSAEPECRIPQAISPNGDGYNDFFVVPCAGEGPMSLIVFNRWGSEVYRNENYQNNWDGRYLGGVRNMQGMLPDGTYYYILRYTNQLGEAIDRAGFVVIHR